MGLRWCFSRPLLAFLALRPVLGRASSAPDALPLHPSLQFLLIIVIGLFSENDEDGGGDVESPYATGKSAAAQGYPGGTAYPTGPGTAPAGMTPGGVMRG